MLTCIRTGLVVGAVVISTAVSQAASVITFDESNIDPGPVTAVATIPNGYSGLNWNNFQVLNTTNTVIAPGGFNNGLVSSPDVAFTQGPSFSGYFSSGSPFMLDSFYLTSAWRTGLNVQVQGFLGGVGGTLEDNTTLTVDTAAATLFNFNWAN